MTKAQIGSVSWGTMRDTDLIQSFVSELEDIGTVSEHSKLIRECYQWLEVDANGADDDASHDELAGYLIEGLFEALETYAPEGCYFGAHEGDGADYGFWPADE